MFPATIKQLLRVIEFHCRGLIHHSGCLSDSLYESCIAEQVSGAVTHVRMGMLKSQICFVVVLFCFFFCALGKSSCAQCSGIEMSTLIKASACVCSGRSSGVNQQLF